MVLSPERVKPFLLHEDRLARAAAADYFRAEHCPAAPDPELAPIAMRCADEGLEGGLELIDTLGFGLNAHTLLDFIAACLRHDERGTPTGTPLESWREIAQGTVRDAPLPLLVEARDRLIDLGFLNARDAAAVDRRIERHEALQQETTDALWDQLQRHLTTPRRSLLAPGTWFSAAPMPRDLAELTDVICTRDVNKAPLIDALRQLPTDATDWRHDTVMRLIARYGPDEAVPILIDRLQTALVPQFGATIQALLGCPGSLTVPAAVAAWPRLPLFARCVLPGLFAGTRTADSEAGLISLLLTEADPFLRRPLAKAACTLLSERGFGLARHEGKSDRQLGESLRDKLVGAAIILDIPLPEAAEWRQKSDRRRNKLEALRARLRARGLPTEGLMVSDTDMDVETLARAFERSTKVAEGLSISTIPTPGETPDQSAWPTPGKLGRRRSLRDQLRAAPVRHHGARVGRNAPCPCDSGRKFKKCCGSRRRRRPS